MHRCFIFSVDNINIVIEWRWCVHIDYQYILILQDSVEHKVLFVLISVCLLRSAGNESCPQPQTSEHLAAIEIMKLKHILILQNKIDLVKESQAHDQYEQILKFIQGQGRVFMFTAKFK